MKSFVNKLVKKFGYAFTGLRYGLCHDSSIRTQGYFGVLAILMGVIWQFQPMEWIVLIFAIVLVIAFELINSSLERLCDLTSPAVSEEVKRIKDFAAGAVLVTSIGAFVIALILIGGKL